MRRGLAIALLLAGCKSANPNAVGDAVLGTAAGLTAAGVSRSQGGCYASCAFGTFCDEKSGMCIALPCHDQCGRGELCDTSGPVDRCVVDPELEVKKAAAQPGGATDAPAAIDASERQKMRLQMTTWPCHGLCKAGEVCDTSGPADRCVFAPSSTPTLAPTLSH